MSLPTDFAIAPPLYAGHEAVGASAELEVEQPQATSTDDLEDRDEGPDRACPTVDAEAAPAPEEARVEPDPAPSGLASNPDDPPVRADRAEGPRGAQTFSLYLGFRGHAGGLFLLGDSYSELLCGYSFEPDCKRRPGRR